MSNQESLPAQYQAPFRVDPLGLTRKVEQQAQMPSEEQLDAIIAAAELTGGVILESEVSLVA